ncbi:probable dicarboxylate carrier protein [Phialocephala subalpina]|uniref:Probable dicarboxylate carrier protein n=1 Tax=Phialocephala subalpina TaxID=576137 RepID=A0A1L7WEV1_9HELO|nr:probable dicarboxylate carrier protein [Phialocephala subalpina]
MAKAQQPFWLGGASASMAACFTHPLDRTKYCMQVLASKQPMLKAMHTFAVRDGIPSLWSGLSASILRQTTYSTARFALYDVLARQLQQRRDGKLSATDTIACAGVAGGLAGMIGNPTEVVLVRMCSDGVKDAKQRYRYPNALSGLVRIGREEGLGAFTKGLGPNIVRSILMNVSQIAVYSSAKRQLLSNNFVKLSDGVPVHIAASLIAGTVATTVCAPADVLKSRLQNAATAKGETPGLVKILATSLKNEGPRFLMKGWTPAWLRLAPNTVLMFIFMEQLQRLFAAKSTL